MKKNSVTISFLGDISLNDKYRTLYDSGVKPFEGISKILLTSDFVIGNLECIAEGNQGENLLKKPRLKTDVKTLNYLKDLNINLVTLAHNHVYDHLLSGFLNTIGFLDMINIRYLGAGTSKEQAVAPFLLTINDISFCFFNYVTKDTNCNLPVTADVYLNWFCKEKIVADIKKYRNKVDYIIPLLHWGGNMEGGLYPHFEQPEIAKSLIDAGADLIIGHHSHTLQPYEVYKNKYIFYSLGNFCFSNIYSDGKLIEIERGKNTESAILNIIFYRKAYSINLIPIENKELFIHRNDDIFKKYRRKLIYFILIKKIKPLWKLYFLKYKYYEPVIYYFFGNDRRFLDRLKMLNWQKILYYFK